VRRRAELYYQQLERLRPLHQEARRALCGRRQEAQRDEIATPDFASVRFFDEATDVDVISSVCSE
jgi:hypothetical protein